MIYSSWNKECDRLKLVIICHFLPFNFKNQNFEKMKKKKKKTPWRYYHFTIVYHKSQSYNVWFLRYGEFHVILDPFVHFSPSPTNNPKNYKVEKMKKTNGNIILHLHTSNDSYTMYGSWDIEHDRPYCLSFWAIFCPFTPLTTKSEKTTWRYHFIYV